MEPLTAAIVLVGLVVVASVIGVLLRRPRVRRESSLVDLATLEVTPGRHGTVVQFSTAYCGRCPGVRRALTPLVADHDGIAFGHVDLTDRIELAERFDVRQTPTVLVVDAHGTAVARFSGVVRPQDVSATLATLTREADHVR